MGSNLPLALSGDCLSVVLGFVDDLSVARVCREWARVMEYVRRTLTYYVCPLRETYICRRHCRLCVRSDFWSALLYWNSCRVGLSAGTMIFPGRSWVGGGDNYARIPRALPAYCCANPNHQHPVPTALIAFPMSDTETKVVAEVAPEKPKFARKPKAPKKEEKVEGKKPRKKDTVRESVKKATKKPVEKEVKTKAKPRAPKKGALSESQQRLVAAVSKCVLDGLGTILAPKDNSG